jgi:MIP family channel proteins
LFFPATHYYHSARRKILGMMFFVFIGCGTAVGWSSVRPNAFAEGSNDQLPKDTNTLIRNSTTVLTSVITINSSFGVNTAFAFGMGIMVLAYSIGHISGCHLNPAVTLSLFLSGNCNIVQSIANISAQVVGSILAASFLFGMVANADESSLGSNSISPGITTGEALLGEVVMTGFLCFVVHMTVADPRNKTISPMAPLAIGFAVFLGHTVLIPVDGCSINPARSLGPAIISGNWENFWVFVVGPFIGSFFGVFFWLLVSLAWDVEAERVTPAPASPGELPGVTSDYKYARRSSSDFARV